MRQICSAIQFLHAAGGCHRDLKPENILIDANANCKVSDFDMAEIVGPNALSKLKVGTPGYFSPECLNGIPYNPQKSDVWAVGLIFYAMVIGRLPWDSQNQKQIANQIRHGHFDIPSSYGPEFVRIIKGLLTRDPTHRMELDEVLEDQWMIATADA
jgi:serine/threonine protein kinase